MVDINSISDFFGLSRVLGNSFVNVFGSGVGRNPNYRRVLGGKVGGITHYGRGIGVFVGVSPTWFILRGGGGSDLTGRAGRGPSFGIYF